jgi:hypothetical protein
MSTNILLRRSAVPGNIPTTAQLNLGELAINTADGKIYFKKYDAGANTETIIDISSNLDAAAILAELLTVDGAGTGLDSDLLDGFEGTYYLDWANFTNTATTVTAGTYGSASEVPVFTVDADGRLTAANTVSVAGVSNTTWTAANTTFTIDTADGNSYNTIIDTFNLLDVTTNITVGGLVDGRDVAADGAKLDLLEDGLDLTLTGKVTGFASSNTGVMSLVTELANTGVIAGVYGSSTSIPVFTVDEDGRLTTANTTPVAGVDNFTYAGANNTITLETGDGSIFNIQTETEVTLSGKVTGTATSTTGTVSIVTELENTGVTAGTYGSPTAIPVLTIDEDGRITVANTASVAGVDDFFWTPANNTLILQTGDGTEYIVPIQEFNDITVNDLTANNVIVSGTVDGRDIATDGSKLDGIEAGATADQTAQEILDLLLTVDGDGSGLDADSVDGYSASEILNAAANNAASLIGAGDVTIYANTGVLVSGDFNFNLNSANNHTIVIEHSDTSSIVNVNLSLPNVLTGLTFDTFGHAQSATSTDLDTRYYTETELNAGQLNNLYYTETELNAGQLDTRYYTETELNAGQLDTRYYTETELNAGQLNNLYYTETELNAGQLNNLYYTETEADTRFVNVTGDTMSGALTVNADIIQSESKFTSISQTTASTSQVAILTFVHASYAAAEVLVTATEGGERHITKLLITHDGSTAVATEYGVVYTSTELATFDVSIAGSNLELRTTPVSSGSTVFKVVATLIDA